MLLLDLGVLAELGDLSVEVPRLLLPLPLRCVLEPLLVEGDWHYPVVVILLIVAVDDVLEDLALGLGVLEGSPSVGGPGSLDSERLLLCGCPVL